MKASEARSLMDNRPDANMPELYKWIAYRAKNGFSDTWLTDERITENQLKELLSNGYQIEIKNSNYKISW